jgi:signal transduction histidine kinase
MVSENAASQGRFAAALSHELNNPLGALSSALDTVVRMHDRERNDPDQRQRMAGVFDNAAKSGREAAGRLAEIIERMKRVSNLDRDDEQLVDLNELLRDTVTFLGEDVERNTDPVIDLSPLPRVQCHPQQMSAVFSRLLRKMIASNSGTSKVFVKSQLCEGEIVIEFKSPI